MEDISVLWDGARHCLQVRTLSMLEVSTWSGGYFIFSNLSPIFKGLGFVNFIAQAFIGLYYNMIIAWTIYYFFASFTSSLPWQYCDNDYNDEKCFSFSGFKECDEMRLNLTAQNITNNIIYLNR